MGLALGAAHMMGSIGAREPYTILHRLDNLIGLTQTEDGGAPMQAGIVNGKLKIQSTGTYSANESWRVDAIPYVGAFDLVVRYDGAIINASGSAIDSGVFAMSNDAGDAQLVFGRSYETGVLGGFTDGDGFRAHTYNGAANTELFFATATDTQGYLRIKVNSDRSSMKLYTSPNGTVWTQRYSGDQSALFNTVSIRPIFRLSGSNGASGDAINFFNFGRLA